MKCVIQLKRDIFPHSLNFLEWNFIVGWDAIKQIFKLNFGGLKNL